MSDLIQEVKEALQAATKGPWTIWERSDGIQVVETDGELSICDMDGGTWQEWKDNAHLIANSPTWLKNLINMIEGLEEELNQERSGRESRSEMGQVNP